MLLGRKRLIVRTLPRSKTRLPSPRNQRKLCMLRHARNPCRQSRNYSRLKKNTLKQKRQIARGEMLLGNRSNVALVGDVRSTRTVTQVESIPIIFWYESHGIVFGYIFWVLRGKICILAMLAGPKRVRLCERRKYVGALAETWRHIGGRDGMYLSQSPTELGL